jgi:hypothetical protein
MTWSYNTNLLAINPKDAVRLLIGDVLQSDPQMQDEEIAYLVASRGTLYGAAAECCRALAAKFGRTVDQQAGTTKLSYSQLAKAYTLKSIEFETKATLSGAATPYAGGISLSDKQLQDLNQDRVQPAFTKGMDDNTLPDGSDSSNETVESFGGPGNR